MAEINTMGHSESSQCKQDAEEQSLDLPANVMARLRELDLLPTEIPEHPKAIEIRRQVSRVCIKPQDLQITAECLSKGTKELI